MFTGIIRAVGRLIESEPRGGDLRLHFDTGGLTLGETRLGDSIAVNGVCLTAVELDGQRFAADVSRETLSLTTLGDLQPGGRVNLEPALRAGDALGGHLVSGHVDTTARVLERSEDARSWRLRIEMPAAVASCLAPKGSVCVDGVSLTVNEVLDDRFGVNIVPHTLEATIMDEYREGTRVNLEIDVLARYVQRALALGGRETPMRETSRNDL